MNDEDFSHCTARANDNPMGLWAYEVEAEQRAAAAIARVRRFIMPDEVGSQNVAHAARADDNPMGLRAYELEAEQRAAAATARVRRFIMPDEVGSQNVA